MVLETSTQPSPPSANITSSRAFSDAPASLTSYNSPSMSLVSPTQLWAPGLRNGGRKSISSKNDGREAEGPKRALSKGLERCIYAGEKQEVAGWTR